MGTNRDRSDDLHKIIGQPQRPYPCHSLCPSPRCLDLQELGKRVRARHQDEEAPHGVGDPLQRELRVRCGGPACIAAPLVQLHAVQYLTHTTAAQKSAHLRTRRCTLLYNNNSNKGCELPNGRRVPLLRPGLTNVPPRGQRAFEPLRPHSAGCSGLVGRPPCS